MSRYYTGKKIVIEEDTNPNSPTFGQTRTREEVSSDCDFLPSMTLIEEREEEIEGVIVNIKVFEDTNEYSPLFGERIGISDEDSTPIEQTYKTECIQILYNYAAYGNSGQVRYYKVDVNPYSSTYKELFEEVEDNTDLCSLPDQTPTESEQYTCELVSYPPNSIMGPSGEKNIYVYDINPFSPTYGSMIGSRQEEDFDLCKLPNTEPNIKVHCSMCEVEDGEMTGNLITYYQDLNAFSDGYTPADTYKDMSEYSRLCRTSPVPPTPGKKNVIYFNANFSGTPYINSCSYDPDATWRAILEPHEDWIVTSDVERYTYKALIPDGYFPTFDGIEVIDIYFGECIFEDFYNDSYNINWTLNWIGDSNRQHTNRLKTIEGINIGIKHTRQSKLSSRRGIPGSYIDFSEVFSDLAKLESLTFASVDLTSINDLGVEIGFPVNFIGMLELGFGYTDEDRDRLKFLDLSQFWKVFDASPYLLEDEYSRTDSMFDGRFIETLVLDDFQYNSYRELTLDQIGLVGETGYPDKMMTVYNRAINRTEVQGGNVMNMNYYYLKYANLIRFRCYFKVIVRNINGHGATYIIGDPNIIPTDPIDII